MAGRDRPILAALSTVVLGGRMIAAAMREAADADRAEAHERFQSGRRPSRPPAGT